MLGSLQFKIWWSRLTSLRRSHCSKDLKKARQWTMGGSGEEPWQSPQGKSVPTCSRNSTWASVGFKNPCVCWVDGRLREARVEGEATSEANCSIPGQRQWRPGLGAVAVETERSENPSYILKVKPLGFPSRLHVTCGRNGGIRNDSKVDQSNWRMEIPLAEMRRLGKSRL